MALEIASLVVGIAKGAANVIANNRHLFVEAEDLRRMITMVDEILHNIPVELQDRVFDYIANVRKTLRTAKKTIKDLAVYKNRMEKEVKALVQKAELDQEKLKSIVEMSAKLRLVALGFIETVNMTIQAQEFNLQQLCDSFLVQFPGEDPTPNFSTQPLTVNRRASAVPGEGAALLQHGVKKLNALNQISHTSNKQDKNKKSKDSSKPPSRRGSTDLTVPTNTATPMKEPTSLGLNRSPSASITVTTAAPTASNDGNGSTAAPVQLGTRLSADQLPVHKASSFNSSTAPEAAPLLHSMSSLSQLPPADMDDTMLVRPKPANRAEAKIVIESAQKVISALKTIVERLHSYVTEVDTIQQEAAAIGRGTDQNGSQEDKDGETMSASETSKKKKSKVEKKEEKAKMEDAELQQLEIEDLASRIKDQTDKMAVDFHRVNFELVVPLKKLCETCNCTDFLFGSVIYRSITEIGLSDMTRQLVESNKGMRENTAYLLELELSDVEEQTKIAIAELELEVPNSDGTDATAKEITPEEREERERRKKREEERKAKLEARKRFLQESDDEGSMSDSAPDDLAELAFSMGRKVVEKGVAFMARGKKSRLQSLREKTANLSQKLNPEKNRKRLKKIRKKLQEKMIMLNLALSSQQSSLVMNQSSFAMLQLKQEIVSHIEEGRSTILGVKQHVENFYTAEQVLSKNMEVRNFWFKHFGSQAFETRWERFQLAFEAEFGEQTRQKIQLLRDALADRGGFVNVYSLVHFFNEDTMMKAYEKLFENVYVPNVSYKPLHAVRDPLMIRGARSSKKSFLKGYSNLLEPGAEMSPVFHSSSALSSPAIIHRSRSQPYRGMDSGLDSGISEDEFSSTFRNRTFSNLSPKTLERHLDSSSIQVLRQRSLSSPNQRKAKKRKTKRNGFSPSMRSASIDSVNSPLPPSGPSSVAGSEVNSRPSSTRTRLSKSISHGAVETAAVAAMVATSRSSGEFHSRREVKSKSNSSLRSSVELTASNSVLFTTESIIQVQRDSISSDCDPHVVAQVGNGQFFRDLTRSPSPPHLSADSESGSRLDSRSKKKRKSKPRQNTAAVDDKMQRLLSTYGSATESESDSKSSRSKPQSMRREVSGHRRTNTQLSDILEDTEVSPEKPHPVRVADAESIPIPNMDHSSDEIESQPALTVSASAPELRSLHKVDHSPAKPLNNGQGAEVCLHASAEVSQREHQINTELEHNRSLPNSIQQTGITPEPAVESVSAASPSSTIESGHKRATRKLNQESNREASVRSIVESTSAALPSSKKPLSHRPKSTSNGTIVAPLCNGSVTLSGTPPPFDLSQFARPVSNVTVPNSHPIKVIRAARQRSAGANRPKSSPLQSPANKQTVAEAQGEPILQFNSAYPEMHSRPESPAKVSSSANRPKSALPAVRPLNLEGAVRSESGAESPRVYEAKSVVVANALQASPAVRPKSAMTQLQYTAYGMPHPENLPMKVYTPRGGTVSIAVQDEPVLVIETELEVVPKSSPTTAKKTRFESPQPVHQASQQKRAAKKVERPVQVVTRVLNGSRSAPVQLETNFDSEQSVSIVHPSPSRIIIKNFDRIAADSAKKQKEEERLLSQSSSTQNLSTVYGDRSTTPLAAAKHPRRRTEASVAQSDLTSDSPQQRTPQRASSAQRRPRSRASGDGSDSVEKITNLKLKIRDVESIYGTVTKPNPNVISASVFRAKMR
eukprot:GILK01006215.1.p1 GENE.GILK01006215.1~~GILK01006215.1.p1  ORF type:complete len:1703 (+),score=408.37 GILK01006215.1:123-5231(+)